VSIAHFTLCLPSNERRAAGFCGLGTAAQLLLARFLPWRGGRKKRKRTTDPAPCAEPKHGAAYGNRSGGTARPSIPVRWLVVWPHNDGPPAAESVPVFLSSSWLWAAPCLLGPAAVFSLRPRFFVAGSVILRTADGMWSQILQWGGNPRCSAVPPFLSANCKKWKEKKKGSRRNTVVQPPFLPPNC
jgi:hypothetical protein